MIIHSPIQTIRVSIEYVYVLEMISEKKKKKKVILRFIATCQRERGKRLVGMLLSFALIKGENKQN